MSSAPSRSKLPFWKTLGRAYGCVFGNPGRLMMLASFPVVLANVAFAAITFILHTTPIGLRAGLFAGSVLVFSTIFVVAWHRFVVLGWESHAAGPRVRFGKREATYLALVCVACTPLLFAWLLVGTSVSVVSPISEAIPVSVSRGLIGGAVTICLVVVCLFPRFALLLPAVSLDERLSLRSSWSMTRGVAFRLTALLLLPVLVYVSPFSTLIWAREGGATLLAVLAIHLYVGYIISLAALATILSFTFMHVRAANEHLPSPNGAVTAGDDVLMWTLDRDFGWLYIVAMSLSVAGLLHVGWFFWGWAGVVTAIVPCLMAVRSLVHRAAVLLEDSALTVDRDTLKLSGRFGEMTFYLKDIREVTLRRALGRTDVCLTFGDLDGALAHTFLVAKERPTAAYATLFVVLKSLGSMDAIALVGRLLKGDFSGGYLGRQVDLYKEGGEQYVKDFYRETFKRYGFHLNILPIFRNRSMLELAREIDRRRQAAKVLT